MANEKIQEYKPPVDEDARVAGAVQVGLIEAGVDSKMARLKVWELLQKIAKKREERLKMIK